MLVRLVIGIIILVAAYVAYRRISAMLGAGPRPAIDAKTAKCAHCGVYFPRTEAVAINGRLYCSRQHADQREA